MKRSVEYVSQKSCIFYLMYLPLEIMCLIMKPLDRKGGFHSLFGLLCINKESYERFPRYLPSLCVHDQSLCIDLDYKNRHDRVPFTTIRRHLKEWITHISIRRSIPLDLTGFSRLSHMTLIRGGVDMEMMRQLPSLTSLDMSRLIPQYKYDALHTLTNLRCLQMSHNRANIDDECLSQMTNLTSLDISCIKSRPNQLTREGIKSLVNLTYLDIHDNDMFIEGDFTRFTSLHTLRIDWGRFSPANSHSIYLIPNLTKLNIVLTSGTQDMPRVREYVSEYPSMKNVKVCVG